MSLNPEIGPILEALYATYGRHSAQHLEDDEQGDDLLGTLIEAILSQSTTNINSSKAFDQLLTTFEGSFTLIAQAPTEQVVEAIRAGGLAKQKAPRIQAILRTIARDQGGDYSLESLRDRPPADALAYLEALPGVGPKTASYVLMDAARMPIFAMNVHILRLCKRLGWVPESANDKKAHQLMAPHIPPGEHLDAHVAMIKHGRARCHLSDPSCDGCVLLASCPYGQTRLAEQASSHT